MRRGGEEMNNNNQKKVNPKLRWQILRRDNFACVLCGRKAVDRAVLEVDHIIPVVEGGSSEDSNLRTTCFECNRGRSSRRAKRQPAFILNEKIDERAMGGNGIDSKIKQKNIDKDEQYLDFTNEEQSYLKGENSFSYFLDNNLRNIKKEADIIRKRIGKDTNAWFNLTRRENQILKWSCYKKRGPIPILNYWFSRDGLLSLFWQPKRGSYSDVEIGGETKRLWEEPMFRRQTLREKILGNIRMKMRRWRLVY